MHPRTREGGPATAPGVAVFGTGGHARVLADILERLGCPIAAVLDDDPAREGATVFGAKVLGGRTKLTELTGYGIAEAAIAIGSNAARLRIGGEVEAVGLGLATVVHPVAVISASAEMGAGTVVMAGAVVNPFARIGRLAVINTSATVDHDCRLGDGVFLGPGVNLGGDVEVGEGTLVGVGAAVRPGIRIGAHAVIGAGAAVVEDVPEGATVLGVPARVAARESSQEM